VGTGDFTHPGWLRELAEKLEPAGEGLFQLKRQYRLGADIPESCRSDVFFLFTAEISCIYRKHGRTHKVHCLVLMPDLHGVSRLNNVLARIGNIKSDGRPILGLDAKELLKITLDAASDALFVPAHVWTPHFSVFGAASGFDSLSECFEELTPYIYAVETGLSSDPPMNWRLPELDNVTLISNSDAHSPRKLGREANLLATPFSYDAITGAIRTGQGFEGTIEFFPEEGKYHYDGHRSCGVVFSPRESIARDCRCPVCGRRVTIGVAHRVEVLSEREEGYILPSAPPFRPLIPLDEILSRVMGVGANSKKVRNMYLQLLRALGSELGILLDAPLDAIADASSPPVAEAVRRMRAKEVVIHPGYDGQYGHVSIMLPNGLA
jgi:uncharacterized protein (TIGR00375 family)